MDNPGDPSIRRGRLNNFGFRARVPFEQGLKETIEWYRSSRKTAAPETRA
jgi:nucleoside-diphosphate-sugar epimerase